MSLFSNIKDTFHLLKQIDLKQLKKLSEKVDLPEVMKQVGELDDKKLGGLLKLLKGTHSKKELPPVDGDFYDIGHTLNPEERALQLKVRSFMEKEVAPIANDYWRR